jgi:LuxR family maltose regulon positive regulatory protein
MESYISQILAAFQMEEQNTPAPDLKNPLTKRELQMLRLLATDLSPQDIASEMTVSPTTTRTHIRNVYQKLGVHSRFEVVQRAKELTLL